MCTAIAVAFHYVWCQIFVIWLDYGIVGTGISNVITQSLTFLLLIFYTNTQEDIAKSIQWPNEGVYDGLREYFAIGIPSTIMLCLDWWVWELLILISGYLGVHEQATNIVIMNIILIAYMITMGLEQAACTLIGH